MFNKELMRRLREEKGLSMAQLAEQVGVSAPFINYLEHGSKEPTARTLYHLSRALGCTMDELWVEI